MPTRFLVGVTENPGEFLIDLQNSVTRVEQNDGFWYSRKQPIEEGPWFTSDSLAQQRLKRIRFPGCPVSACLVFPVVSRESPCSIAQLKEHYWPEDAAWNGAGTGWSESPVAYCRGA